MPGGTALGTGGFQPAGRGVAAPMAGNRLPTAPRERKPALAALAVLLILAGALATMTLVTRSGNRVSVIEMKSTVAAGVQITDNDLQEAQVAEDPGLHYVLWSQKPQIVGKSYGSTLFGGSVLVKEMLVAQPMTLKPGEVMLGLLFKDGQYPAKQLQRDNVVELWAPVATSTSGGSANNQAGPIQKIATGRIIDIPETGQTLGLTLAVAETDASKILSAGNTLQVLLAGSS